MAYEPNGTIKLARAIARDDKGKHVGYDGEQRYILIDDKWYAVDWIKSVPGLLPSDLCFRETD